MIRNYPGKGLPTNPPQEKPDRPREISSDDFLWDRFIESPDDWDVDEPEDRLGERW